MLEIFALSGRSRRDTQYKYKYLRWVAHVKKFQESRTKFGRQKCPFVSILARCDPEIIILFKKIHLIISR